MKNFNQLSSTKKQLWMSFLLLEKQLINTFQYVEYCENNLPVHSVVYRSIILSACSDLIACLSLIFPADSNIKHICFDYYRDKIMNKHKDFKQIKIKLSWFNETVQPWSELTKKTSPKFWSDHNEIKHKNAYEGIATLENARDALSALFAGLLAYYFAIEKVYYSLNIAAMKELKLFSYKGFTSATALNPCLGSPIIIPGFLA